MASEGTALTLSEGGEAYAVGRKLTKKDHNPVPLRWQAVLALHLAGKPATEIMKLTGYSSTMVYRILSNKDVQYLRQQMMASTQLEFEAMFSKVTSVIRTNLESSDPQVQLTATNQWFKANGKFTPATKDKGDGLTAEDVVNQMLNQVNVQVNVNAK